MLVYLVSDTKKISIAFTRPRFVRVRETRKGRFWYFRSFKRGRVGEGITEYTDNLWNGPIGVFDVSIPEHVKNLVERVIAHALAIADTNMEYRMGDLCGTEAAMEVGQYKVAMSSAAQRDFKWSPLGRLLFSLETAMHEVCNEIKRP